MKRVILTGIVMADAIRLLPSGAGGRSAGRADLENALRIQRRRNGARVPDHDGHDREPLARTRDQLRHAEVPFEIPAGPELSARLDSVLDVLYLLFNEGYNASHGSDLIRRDLCDEAIRLTTLLLESLATETPKTDALLALFLFQAARFPEAQEGYRQALRPMELAAERRFLEKKLRRFDNE